MSDVSPSWNRTISVALTGASGGRYGLRLIECLVQAGARIYLMLSPAGQVVLKMEEGVAVPSRPAEIEAFFTERFHARPGQIRAFGRQQWTAPVASGSNPADAMVICPCTTGTLASIAAGISSCLIDRAADVMMKERRPLLLVLRETPYTEIHLENMLRLTRAGAVIMPANPGFYHDPHGIDDLIDFMVARILDHLNIPHTLQQRWGEELDTGD